MNFVTVDFETAKYSRESACSVGLVKIIDGKRRILFIRLYDRPNFTYARILPRFTDLQMRTLKTLHHSLIYGTAP